VSDFDGIIGQTIALDTLRRLIDAERIPHAMVFQGPEGVGKATVARILATTLLCENRSACTTCRSCRMLANNSHPDFILIKRELKEKSKELSKVVTVDQIREVHRLAGLSPREGLRRFFLIDPADRMNFPAQNALLKTLEEPPGPTVIVLVASRPSLLVPTVRSRCITLRFSALRARELSRALEARGMAADEAGARAALAGGRPGRALELDLSVLRERREAIFELIESLAAGQIAGLSDAPALAGKEDEVLLDSLEAIQTLLRDAARAGGEEEAPALVNADLAPRLRRLGERLGAERAAALVESVDRLRGYLRFNTNRTMIAESLLAAIGGGPIP